MCIIMAALKRGDLIDVKKIIKSEVEVINFDEQDEQGITPLQFATQNGYSEVVQSLLLAGADPNIINNTEQAYENDLLAGGIKNENDKNKIIEEMLDELQSLGSVSALHIAIKFKQLKIARLLLTHGANPNILDTGNCTPLHWAAVKGFSAGVQLLLEHQADPNIQDLANSTALHEAMRKKNSTIIKLLLEKKANPNLQDIGGDTACSLVKEDPRLTEVLLTNTKFLPEGWLSH